MHARLVWLAAVVVWSGGVYATWAGLRTGTRWPAPVPPDRLVVTVVPGTRLAATLRETDDGLVGPVELYDLETGERTASHPLPDGWDTLYRFGDGLLFGSPRWADGGERPPDQVIEAATGRLLASSGRLYISI